MRSVVTRAHPGGRQHTHYSPFIQFVLHGLALPITSNDFDLVDLHKVSHLPELHIVQHKCPNVVTEPVGVQRSLEARQTAVEPQSNIKLLLPNILTHITVKI